MVTIDQFFGKFGFGISQYSMNDSKAGIWNAQGESVYAGLNNFRSDAVRFNLQEMKNWGFKHVRIIFNARWLAYDVEYCNNMRVICEIANELGLQIILSGYTISPDVMGSQESIPYGNDLFPTIQDFAQFWKDVASFFNLPNVCYELWNEPNDAGSGSRIAEYFQAAQLCINKIREINNNAIMIQWDYAIWGDIAYPNLEGNITSNLFWIWSYPLTDSADNLIYDSHFYPPHCTKQGVQITTYEDMQTFFDMALVTKALSEGKKLGFETGISGFWEAPNPVWYTNTLKLLQTKKIAATAGVWTTDAHMRFGVLADALWMPPPNEAGLIVRQRLTQVDPLPEPPVPSSPLNTGLILVVLVAGIGILAVLLVATRRKKT